MSDLSHHRIDEVEVSSLVSRYPRTVGKNSHLGTHGDGPVSTIAIVRTNQGAVGWGLIRGPQRSFEDIIGRNLPDLFDTDVGVIAPEAEPLDFALHDLAGVVLNQPVYQMLGSTGETTVPCYDGAIYLDDLDPEDSPRGIDAVLENCTNDYALGYRAFKLKIGRGYKWMSPEDGLQRDVDVTHAVSERFPDCRVLVDANNGLARNDFLTYLDGIRDCNLYWIEEPFQESREDLASLRAYLDDHDLQTLIADGEEAHGQSQADTPYLLSLASDRLIDVLIMDIVTFGFTAWRQLMPTLREIGVSASPHTWGVPVKSLYTAQLAAGVGNVPTVEGVLGSADGVDSSSYRLHEGDLHVPAGPGFGLEPPAAQGAMSAG